MVLGIANVSSTAIVLLCLPAQAGSASTPAAELRPLAAVVAGESVVNVGRDADGMVTWAYGPETPAMSQHEHASGLDDDARMDLAVRRAKVNIWTGYLVEVADADGSGDTSIAEARALRHEVEVVFLARQLARPVTLRRLAELLHEDQPQVLSDLVRYQRVFDQAIRDDMVGLPKVPEGLLGAA